MCGWALLYRVCITIYGLVCVWSHFPVSWHRRAVYCVLGWCTVFYGGVLCAGEVHCVVGLFNVC